MKKEQLNIFNYRSKFFPFRWFIISMLIIVGMMSYYNLNGGRMFNFKSQQQWSSSGPGYHK